MRAGETPVRGQCRALNVPEEAPQGVVDLISDCCQADPAARPSAKGLVARIKQLAAIPRPPPPQTPPGATQGDSG